MELNNMQSISTITQMKIQMIFTILIGLLISQNLAIYETKDSKHNYCPEMESNPSKCSCNYAYSNYKILCPALNPKIIIKSQSNVYMYIDCKQMLPKDYALLPAIHIGNVSLVQLKRCPLPPGQPIKRILDRLGAKNVRTLLFQIYDADLGGPLLREHFKELSDLERLVISVKGLTSIPDDLFIDLKNLTWLDFRAPNVHFPKDIFQTLNKLDNLELGGNKLEYLENGIFRNQDKLIHLNLWGNSLKNLTKDTFEGLSAVTDLDISANNISTFSFDVFSQLKNLTALNLNANYFNSLPENLFTGNKNLVKFSLIENRTPLPTLPSGLLSNLPNLQDVRIKCYLEHVPDDLFKGSAKLHNISLSNNYIEYLPSNLFADQINLLVLDLSHNVLSDLPDELFSNTRSLLVLSLSFNHLANISKNTFNHLQSLHELYLDNNQLYQIHSEAFIATQSLQILDMHNNKLSFDESNIRVSNNRNIDSGLSFRTLKELRQLNLRNNSIANIFHDWLFYTSQLEEIDLSYNNITFFNYNDLQVLSNHIKINLTYNSISKINFQNIEYLNFDIDSEEIEIFLESNPIICNCKILKFIQFLRKEIAIQTSKILKIIPGDLKCSAPSELEGKFVTAIHPKELLCPLEMNLSLIKRCPKKCTCWVRPYDEILLINCTNAELNKVPALPRPEVFKLKSIALHIENNHLIKLPHADLPGYSDVKEIYARHNNINELSLDNIPKNLEVLDLANNNLTWINISTLQKLNRTNKLELSLGNNPWMCSCNKFEFLSFIRNNIQKIHNLDSIYCISEGHEIPILLSENLCTKKDIVIVLCLTVSVLGLIVGILTGLCYKYRKQLKHWLFTQNLKFCFNSKKYDAILIYSDKDEDFINEHLLSHLANDPNSFKLCLYNKSWIEGEFSSHRFTSSVHKSKRIVLILSPNFIEFIWNRIEFRTIYMSAINRRQSHVIIIIYDDIGDIEKLDIELKAYIKMNTHIVWSDPWFWDKLRYLMPHLSDCNQIKNLKDDKLKLIMNDQLISSSSLTKPPTLSITRKVFS